MAGLFATEIACKSVSNICARGRQPRGDKRLFIETLSERLSQGQSPWPLYLPQGCQRTVSPSAQRSSLSPTYINLSRYTPARPLSRVRRKTSTRAMIFTHKHSCKMIKIKKHYTANKSPYTEGDRAKTCCCRAICDKNNDLCQEHVFSGYMKIIIITL